MCLTSECAFTGKFVWMSGFCSLFFCPIFFLWHISLLKHFRISVITYCKMEIFFFWAWVYILLRTEKAKRIIEIRDLFYRKIKWEHKHQHKHRWINTSSVTSGVSPWCHLRLHQGETNRWIFELSLSLYLVFITNRSLLVVFTFWILNCHSHGICVMPEVFWYSFYLSLTCMM
jgi:hypothetical protein